MATTGRPNVRQIIPLLGVTQLPRSLAFYVDGLAFRVVNRWEPDGELRWCMLELGEVALMLQTMAPQAPARREPETLGRGVSLCIQCGDALATYREAVARGLTPEEPFVGNGLWVTGFRDPDGYRLEFASPTDVAEDTTLSEWQASTAG